MKYIALIITLNVAYICFTVREYHSMLEDFMQKGISFEVRIKG